MSKFIKTLTLATLAVILITLAPSARAEIFQNVYTLEQRANRGELKAIFDLAEYYYELGFSETSFNNFNDHKRAYYWLKKAYDGNYSKGIVSYQMGWINANRLKNYPEAIKWYEIAYKEGHKDAAYYLGLIYYDIFKDYPKTIGWFEIAHKQGDKGAAYALGIVYQDNIKDYPNAIKWYEIAHKQGDKGAAYALGGLYRNVIKDYAKAIEWYEISHNQNEKGTAHTLGLLYKNDIKDYAKALEWFQISFDKDNHYGSLCFIGIMYRDGLGVKQDLAKARSLFQTVISKTKSTSTSHIAAKEALQSLDRNQSK